jgi:nickel superoxide dismutase
MSTRQNTVATLIMTVALASIAGAHCQIPCGIYDDQARIVLMEEHVATIEKSMTEIAGLSTATPLEQNQMVRWVMNKEEHADQLTEIVTYYFLAQRIKPDAENYEARLKALHGMMVAAMKCKQTVDLKNVEELKALIHEFKTLYFGVSDVVPHTH